ncbi:MAG: hypothetical protein WCL00_03050 [Bacteroidota bacterium]
MKSLKIILIATALFLISVTAVMAQAPQPPSDPTAGGNQTPSNPSGAPIDGGLTILLALALGYGAKGAKGKMVK